MHWTQNYIGVPYSSGNCIDFAVMILNEHYGKNVQLPHMHDHKEITMAMVPNYAQWAEKIESPVDGCVALFSENADVAHVGLVVIDGLPEPYLLHTMRRHGSSIIEPIRRAKRYMKLAAYFMPRDAK